jgi:ParB family chromosome partitioning protein
MSKTVEKTKSGLALEDIGDLSGLLNDPEVTNNAGPMELPLDLIDEDPNQPRKDDNPGFSKESLQELAETIRIRGVKTPISVRPNPDIEGRYLINHGARRYRSSIMVGKATVPAFIDADYTEADQVIENLQRDGLTPREIANYIGRELARGKKKTVIAREIGKSASFVSQHVTLLDLPEPISEAFNNGRAKDVTVINELVTAYKQDADEVTVWLADESQELTRGSVKLLRDFLEDKEQHKGGGEGVFEDPEETTGDNPGDGDNAGPAPEKKNPPPDPDKLKKAIVQIQHDDRVARLVLTRRPSNMGRAWIKYEDDGSEIEADLIHVELVAVVEG